MSTSRSDAKPYVPRLLLKRQAEEAKKKALAEAKREKKYQEHLQKMKDLRKAKRLLVPQPERPEGSRKVIPKKNKVTVKNNSWVGLTPEVRAERIAKFLKACEGKRGRPAGLPDGIGLKRFNEIKVEVQPEVQKIMEFIVADNKLNLTDDKMAIEALETAVTIMRLPIAYRDKIGAAKLVLEYTKQKPTVKQENHVTTAEGFLEQVLAQESKAK